MLGSYEPEYTLLWSVEQEIHMKKWIPCIFNKYQITKIKPSVLDTRKTSTTVV